MQVKTWLQRLTDESNLWFNAVKSEDEGDLENAVSYYVKDALECIKQRSLVRAALSCSCAANCLKRMGAWSAARTMYSEAGDIYVENSEVAMSESIREALWSLQEAFENYVLAGAALTDSVHDRYVALAKRINPFSQADKPTKSLESRRAEVVKSDPKKDTMIPEILAGEIEHFVNTRKSGAAKTSSLDPAYVMKSIDLNGGSRLNDKSIAS